MSEMNATPATEAATSETQDFLSSVGESEKRVRVSGKAVSDEVVLSTRGVNVYYGDHHALHDTSLDFHKGEITALIGPSGCGKSTFLRSLNLMNREIRGCRVEGEINYRGRNVNTKTENTYELRRSIGMVFQQPNPFPTMSIAENVMAGYTLNGIHVGRQKRLEIIEHTLGNVGLWDEVKDVLTKKGTFLSGGQQQRLCIARALALQPEVLLMDEPTSALDPIATARIEELLLKLQQEVTIIIVTHNMGQARRIAAQSMFMYLGELVEYNDTEKLFTSPASAQTKAYLAGHIG